MKFGVAAGAYDVTIIITFDPCWLFGLPISRDFAELHPLNAIAIGSVEPFDGDLEAVEVLPRPIGLNVGPMGQETGRLSSLDYLHHSALSKILGNVAIGHNIHWIRIAAMPQANQSPVQKGIAAINSEVATMPLTNSNCEAPRYPRAR